MCYKHLSADTYATPLSGQTISMLKEKAEQGSMWENEASLWKHKYNELQQTLVMFNLTVEKAAGVGKDGNNCKTNIVD